LLSYWIPQGFLLLHGFLHRKTFADLEQLGEGSTGLSANCAAEQRQLGSFGAPEEII